MSSIQFKHFAVLDGLRGIAVLAVMLSHISIILPETEYFAKGGFLGVDIFFVLSGFLITSILIKEYAKTGKINLKNFYMRRTFRLVPAFWFFLIILYVFGQFLLPKQSYDFTFNGYNFPLAFTYLLNWYVATGAMTGELTHTWSLSIEEQFYIIWSLVLYKAFSEGRTKKQILIFTILAIFLLMIVRSIRVFYGADFALFYFSTDTRMDGLLIGCITAFIYGWGFIDSFIQSKRYDFLSLLALFLFSFIFFSTSHNDISFYYGKSTLFALAAAIIILWLTTRQGTYFHKLLEFPVLVWIGKISYGLYLWHCVAYRFGMKSFQDPTVQLFFGVIFAFIISLISFYLIEKPFLKYKDKFNN